MTRHPDYLTEEDQYWIRHATDAVESLVKWHAGFESDDEADQRRRRYITTVLADVAAGSAEAARDALISEMAARVGVSGEAVWVGEAS